MSPAHLPGSPSPDDWQVDELEPATARGLNIRWVRDVAANPPPEPPELIGGLLRKGEFLGMCAPRGVGKSWFGMGTSVLLGRGDGYVLGTLKVVQQARVLYCQGELGEWEAAQRWMRLAGTSAPPDGVAETFDPWRLRVVHRRAQTTGSDHDGNRFTESDDFLDSVLDGRLGESIAEHNFDVLVIDPWAVFYSGKENSNDEAEAALSKLRELTRRYGLAVIILHHPGQGAMTARDGREPEDLWRGATRLADWCSTRVTFLPHYSEKQARDQGMTRTQARRYVDVKFLRRGAPLDDFSVRWDSETGWWERWVAPEESAAQRSVDVDVVAACRDYGGAFSSIKEAAALMEIAEATAASRLKAAANRGELEAFKGARRATGYRLPRARLGVS
jgi:hypothetical protein